MKVITEAILRAELKSDEITQYTLPEGKILSPAAREYLQMRKIKLITQKDIAKNERTANTPVQTQAVQSESVNAKFVDYVTGAFYNEKPEHMTHIYGNKLVAKNHPRIAFRGKLDRLEAEIVLTQALIAQNAGREKLVADLGDIMRVCTLIMRSEVLDLPYENVIILGMSQEEIHARSHNPMKYYNIKQLLLPEYGLGVEYAYINKIRAMVREIEVAAVDAFYENGKYTRNDIVMELNRLSSCMHLIGCKYLAGEYK